MSSRVAGWTAGTGVMLGAVQSWMIGKVDAGPGWWAAAVVCTLLVATLAGWLASQTLDPQPQPWAWASRAVSSVVVLRWVSLVMTLLLVVVAVLWNLTGTLPPRIVTGGAWAEYFHDSDPRIAQILRDKGLEVRAFRLSGAEQVNDAAKPSSDFDFYLAPNTTIKDRIAAQFASRGGSISGVVFSTQMVITTSVSVRDALISYSVQHREHQLVRVDPTNGYVHFSMAEYQALVHKGAATPGSHALSQASSPNNLGTGPVGITAPSPCYAGGGWSYIAMLAQAQPDPQNQNDLKKDLEWLYGSASSGSVPLRSDEVQQMWTSHRGGPAYLMYEQAALDILANDQLSDGAILYPDPPAEAEHWIIARKTGDPGHDERMQTLVDLLTTATPDAHALRQRQAQRYAIRFPDAITRDDLALQGAFQKYLDTKLSGTPAANAIISTTALNPRITADTLNFRVTPPGLGVITTQVGNLCQLH